MKTLVPKFLAPGLKFSQRPAEQSAQDDVLARLVRALLDPKEDTSALNRAAAMSLAEQPEMAKILEAVLQATPRTKSRGSFAEMLKLRDETGLVRRHS